MKINKYLDLLLVSIVAYSAYQFYYVWVVWKGFSYLERVAYALEERPFVYRMLVPSLARALEQVTGVHAVYCMIFLFALSAVGLFYSLKYLYTAFRENDGYAGLFAFIGCQLTFLFILIGVKVYDVATVMFFAWALGLLARGKFDLYYLVFAIASINRETTFLLTLFFMVYFFRRLPLRQYLVGLIYQGVAYLVIKIGIMRIYADVPGEDAQWRPMEVLTGYIEDPIWFAVLFLIAFCVFFAIALYRWNEKPLFLRVAFLTMFPVLLILHIFLGYAYEIRVFVEVLPVLLLMCTWSIAGIKNRMAPHSDRVYG